MATDTKIVITAETNQAQRAMQSLGDAAGALSGRIASLSSITAFIPTAAIAGMVALGKGAIDAADNLNDLSQRFGVGIKDLVSYQLAADQSGTSLESVATGLKKLSTNLVENGAALKAAGVDTTSTTTAMRGIADIFATMPDGAEKTALALKLFGKSGTELIPLLNGGAQALEESAEKTARLGEMYERLAPQADELNDKFAELALYSKAFGVSLGEQVVGPMLKLVEVSQQSTGSLNEVAGATDKAANAFNPFAETLRALIVLGGNVKFVFKGVGTEIGGVAAQVAAALQGDFGKVQAIRDAMVEDAKKAREEFDAWEKGVMSADISMRRTSAPASTATSTAGGGRGSRLLGSLGGDDTQAKKALAAANKEAKESADMWVKSIDAQIDAERQLAEATAQAASARFNEIQKFKEIADPLAKYNDQLQQLAELRGRINDGESLNISVEEIDKASDAIRAQRDGLEKTNDIGRQLGLTFSSAFEDAVIGGKSFRDVLGGIAQDLARMAIRKSITEPLFNAFSAFGSSGFSGSSFFQSFMPSVPDGSSVVDLGSLSSLIKPTGSFATGIDYVPRDMTARIHQGERVLTAAENLRYSMGETSTSTGINYAPVINIDSRADRAAVLDDVNAAVKRGNAELVDKLQRAGKL